MSNVESVENLNRLEKLLQQNPHGIRITDAAKKLGVHRSTIYKYLYSLDLRGKAHYERGIAYLGKKVSTKAEEKPSRLNFWEYLKWRAEYNNRQRERELRELEAEVEIRHEIMMMNEYDYTQEKEWEITQKWRKRYGLD